MRGERLNMPGDGAPETYSVETTLLLTGISTACLARYERAQIVTPERIGRRRFYRTDDLKRIRKASRLERDLGINLPGVEVILRLTDQLDDLQQNLAEYEAQLPTGPQRT